MKRFEEFSREAAKKIQYLLCDIDDTITTDGKLTAEAYSALWSLSEAGISVIPVTGRPAGWCDLMIRQWPIKAVIGENGAFVFYWQDQQIKVFTHPLVAGNAQERLQGIRETVLQSIPGTRVSKDQFARIYDLAIDFNEDPPYLGLDVAADICDICCSMGAIAKISSIHVNTWFGDYNKVSMAKLFLKDVLQETEIAEKVLFFGDSPNDEPMFKFFPQSCAVANIRPFLPQLTSLPEYITEEESGSGFVTAVTHMMKLRE